VADPILAWSPDEKLLVVTTRGRAPELRDAVTGRLVSTLGQPVKVESSVTFSLDGKLLARHIDVGAPDISKVELWDVAARKVRAELSNAGGMPKFSPDGKMLAATYGRPDWALDGSHSAWPRLGVWKIGSEQPILLSEEQGDGINLEWSPDGKFLAVAALLTGVAADPKTGKAVKDPRLGKDIPGYRSTLRLWDARTRKSVFDFQMNNRIESLAWLPGSKQLVTVHHVVGQSWVQFWNVAPSGQLTRQGEPRPLPSPRGCVLSPGGEFLLGFPLVNECDICLWETATGRLLRRLDNAAGVVVSWSPSGKTLALGLATFPGYGQTETCFRDTATGRLHARVIRLGTPHELAISPDGHYRPGPGSKEEPVYVVQTKSGQETLTAEEFARKYGWKNEPDRVRLMTDR
jgi:WD40 repeat protein